MIKTHQKGVTGLFQRQKNSKNFPEGCDRFIHRPVYFPLYGKVLNHILGVQLFFFILSISTFPSTSKI